MSEAAPLEQRVSDLERDLAAVARAVPGSTPTENGGRAVADVMWKCRKCNSLLGFYDAEEDILRIRYKDHVTFFKVGGADIVTMAEVAAVIAKQHEVSDEVLTELMEAIAECVDPGLVQVVCRGCTAVNTTHYSPAKQSG